MIQIDIPMPNNCLECRFSWAGDSCTYCVAQCYHKPGGGYHLHKINPTYKSREEQDVWREPSCPLITQEPVEPLIVNGTRYIYCGNCKRPLCNKSDYHLPTFCEECGRKVKWNA